MQVHHASCIDTLKSKMCKKIMKRKDCEEKQIAFHCKYYI